MSNPWKKIDFNKDNALWEATAASGVVIRVTGQGQPPAWLLEHHARRFTERAPEVELGATGVRIRMPDESQWREYRYTPRVLS